MVVVSAAGSESLTVRVKVAGGGCVALSSYGSIYSWSLGLWLLATFTSAGELSDNAFCSFVIFTLLHYIKTSNTIFRFDTSYRNVTL